MTKNARKRKSARDVAGLIQFEKIKIIFNKQIKIINDNKSIPPIQIKISR